MAQVIIDDDPPEICTLQRRKFGEVKYLSLLKEVITVTRKLADAERLQGKFEEVITTLSTIGSMPCKQTVSTDVTDTNSSKLPSIERTDPANQVLKKSLMKKSRSCLTLLLLSTTRLSAAA
jgi:hypothetical protein